MSYFYFIDICIIFLIQKSYFYFMDICIIFLVLQYMSKKLIHFLFKRIYIATLRYYQQETKDEIINELSINSKCLVKMFCGSGKSLIMKNIVEHYNENLSVFVFPSLSLLEQL